MYTLKQISFVLFIFIQFSFAQGNKFSGTKLIDNYLSTKLFKKADSILQLQVNELKSKQLYDSLVNYTYYVGKIALKLSDTKKATNKILKFVNYIKSSTNSPIILRQLYIELASFYELIGNPEKAYQYNLTALDYTSKIKEATGEDYGLIYGNLGTLSKRKGNISLALQHHKKALEYYESYPGSNKENLQIVYNSLGGMMWYSTKIDSALYYYNKAEKVLKLLEQTPINKYYRPALIQNNISAIYSSQGNVKKSMKTMENAISNLNAFIKSDGEDAKKESAKKFLFQNIENYAGIYKDIGDYKKAKELLSYSYTKKKKYFNPDSPELFKTKILMGQIHLALKEYDVANKYLDSGITHINRIPGEFYFWNADAHYYKATVNDELGAIDVASGFYEKGQLLYEKALQGTYDEIYLEFITRASYFYAKNGNRKRALDMAYKAYDYVVKNQGEKTLFEFQQVLNLGEIYYELEDYNLALEKSIQSLSLLKDPVFFRNEQSDSIHVAFQKPQAILLKVKSEYQLNKDKDTNFLKQQLKEIQEAIAVLEQRKSYIGEENNLSILIADNNAIFEFAKKTSLELFFKTNKEKYLNNVISIHESSLYSRIRSRLNNNASAIFKHIPEHILLQEKTIQEKIKNSANIQNDIDVFFEATKKWKNYLDTLKKKYPKYYKLRFASLSEPLDNINSKIPINTSVVRYIYVNEKLYAILINNTTKQIFSLNQDNNLGEKINSLQNGLISIAKASELLNNLYNSLWKPFEDKINTKHVIIIPDRELFNLSFETLTPQPIKNYKGLVNNSLLSNYIISYNYSLLLIDKDKKVIEYDKNFVAFVPEFNDQMKQNYKISIKDSLTLDKTYLTLLPQPFSIDLAKFSSKYFSGDSFLNEKSTKKIFENSAKEHKIIHIGTHAESNNISPELSRLIFAKNISDENLEENNSLYTYEIYNYNLSSNLAILTACETGKPTYQAGEGMISLAHAFNYAGSESILTSLWKIDEQSSTKIVELFYNNISKGLPKDEALQLAKLSYIKIAEGRTVSPQYWAGLVLIGDASPIVIASSKIWIYWILGVSLLFLIGYYFYKRKPTK
ncbi:hypothetical protein MNBD_BACTEROID02-358 [hydrothermal vent metagenome]|uniref:CHAT domain-containing protein n=1 Tax=hydrothermal vent metagenome TaxID=652676 RepID=A0A3B0QQW0_9ZZZZ